MKHQAIKARPKPVRAGPSEQPAPAVRWWAHALAALALFGVAFAFYSGTLNLGFFSLDDPDYVQANPFLTPLTAANLKSILTVPYFANYAPGHLLSYALDIALAGGKQAWAIHLSNVLWYGWVVCMVYALAFTIRPNLYAAVAAAGLFALHPAHVEVVAWISSRKDLVATGFAVASATCYLRYCRSRERGRWWWYAGSLGSFLFASSAKQSVILLPAVMLVWDVLVERRRGWQIFADKLPFGVVTLFFGWMTWNAQPSTRTAPNAFVLAATEFWNLWLLTGCGDYVMYRRRPDPSGVNGGIVSLTVAAALLPWALPILMARLRYPVPAALWAWVMISMIPPMTMTFLTPVTDRYLFLPSAGFCILLAGLVVRSTWERAGPPRHGAVVRTSGQLLSGCHPAGEGKPEAGRRRTRGSASSEGAPTGSLPLGEKAWARVIRSLMGADGGRWKAVTLVLLGGIGLAWGWKTLDYITQWRDPRSVWYFTAPKTGTSQAYEYSGQVYHDSANRVRDFIRAGKGPGPTNDLALAQVLLSSPEQLHALRAEWTGASSSRTNSIAYRDLLWSLAWKQYELAVAHRGTRNTPNLFLRRGMILVDKRREEDAISEFKTGLQLAESHSFEQIRRENVTHLQRAIGVAYWGLRRYAEAREWLLKAQETQRKSGRTWIPTLDSEVEKVKQLAKGKS